MAPSSSTAPSWTGGPGPRLGDEPPSRAHYLWALLGILGGLIGWLLVRDRDRALGRKVLIVGGAVSVVGIVLSVVLYVALYSATQNLAQSLNATLGSSQPFGSTVATTTTSPTVTVPAGTLTKTWSFSATASGGYSMDGTVSVGRPQHYRKGLSNGTTVAGSACQFDSQTVGVIPATLSATNTTKGFSETAGVFIVNVGTQSTTASTTLQPEIRWEAQYTSGGQCDGGTTTGSSVDVTSTQPLGPGQSVSVSGFFIVTNYFSPNHPDGNVAALDGSLFRIPGIEDQRLTTSTGTMVYTIDSVTGPGVKEVATLGQPVWLFTLTGAAPSTSQPVFTASQASNTSPATTTQPTTTTTTTTVTVTTTTATTTVTATAAG